MPRGRESSGDSSRSARRASAEAARQAAQNARSSREARGQSSRGKQDAKRGSLNSGVAPRMSSRDRRPFSRSDRSARTNQAKNRSGALGNDHDEIPNERDLARDRLERRRERSANAAQSVGGSYGERSGEPRSTARKNKEERSPLHGESADQRISSRRAGTGRNSTLRRKLNEDQSSASAQPTPQTRIPRRSQEVMRSARRVEVKGDERSPRSVNDARASQRDANGKAAASVSSKGARPFRKQADPAEGLNSQDNIPHNVLQNPLASSSNQGNLHKGNRFIGACAWLWGKSKAVSVALVVVIALVVVGGIDSLATMNRIYQGVSVGNIDLSGKTVDEATLLISQEYEPRFNSNSAIFCANEDVLARSEEDQQKHESLEEQISYEESLSKRDLWTVNAERIGATFDPAAYAQSAYQVGREDGGFFARVSAQLNGRTITPVCTFNETALGDLRDEIISALGSKMVNFNIEMKDSNAQVTDGHDGYEVSDEWLIEKLNNALLEAEGESRFVIDMHEVTIQIDREAAQVCADKVNASIPTGINFTYGDKQYFADKAVLADWITTAVEQKSASFELLPRFDEAKANQKIIQGFGFTYGGSGYFVHFNNDQGNITVTTNATGAVPQVSEALDTLNETFFQTAEKTIASEVEVSSAQIPETMSFEEALEYGLIVEISSFTTRYASGAEARNNNIHVAADALNNSICKAGESWSFLALSGEATPEKGYQGAGAIIGGEYSDAVGGGICQVATTVFNAVYEAGYPIDRRNNHSLYIASYPEGRDAAIAFPDIDLVWSNNTDSDVLLRMSYTNSSVTATLYGVDPGYEVTTEYGEWQEGEPYRTVVRKDPDYPVGKEFIETSGADGRSITIVRTVKDRNGNIIQEKEFHSNYNPKNEVKVIGSAEPSEPAKPSSE